MMDYEACRRMLEERLKPSRYRHSLGVADTAAALARRFGVDEAVARLAGLLHDAAREFPTETMIDEAEKRGIPIGPIERALPLLLHGPLGAFRLVEIYGVEDEAIRRAVSRHTVGGAGMTPLDKIIYFADMIEPNRNYPGVAGLRRLADSASLNEMTLAGLNRSLIFVMEKGGLIHPDTVTARNEILFTGDGAR